jgi:hypothetical protein
LFGETVELLVSSFRLSGLLPKLVGATNYIHMGNFCHLLSPEKAGPAWVETGAPLGRELVWLRTTNRFQACVFQSGLGGKLFELPCPQQYDFY